MINIKEYIVNNKGFLVVILIITVIISSFACWKINNYFNEKNSIKNQLEEHEKNNNEFLTEARNNDIQIRDDGFYLTNEDGSVICGPYKMIFDDDSYFDIIRFIDQKSGLIGYMSKIDGKVIIKPKFKQASKMRDGPAMVSENGKDIYYISSNGKRITKSNFLNGYPFESQGRYARVQFYDGSWGIINREGEVIADGFQLINELPEMTVIGSGVKNNHAVLFEMGYSKDLKYREIREFPQFCEISFVQGNDFAIVKNNKNLCGIVCGYNGKIIAPAKYINITWDDMELNNKSDQEITVFKAQKEDGTYDVLNINFRKSL